MSNWHFLQDFWYIFHKSQQTAVGIGVKMAISLSFGHSQYESFMSFFLMEVSLMKIIFIIYIHSNKFKCQKSNMKNGSNWKCLQVYIFKHIYGIRGTATVWKNVALDTKSIAILLGCVFEKTNCAFFLVFIFVTYKISFKEQY